MNTAQPIRDESELVCFKEYYRTVEPNTRNYLMMIMGLNTALRISDILEIRWGDVYDFERQEYRKHLSIVEQKTDKCSLIFLNKNVKEALAEHLSYLIKSGKIPEPDTWVFENLKRPGNPISRIQAFRIIKKDAEECHLEGVISCHSLRKTFGYHAWQQGTEPVLLMNIFNHSSFRNTVRYLGIEQDDRDRIFRDINL